MKPNVTLVSLACLLCTTCVGAQGLKSKGIEKEQLLKIGSKLVIGMREADAARLLGANGLAEAWTELHTNRWITHVCYTNVLPVEGVEVLRLHFKPVPARNDTVPTNGILTAAFIGREQVARTNKP